MRYKKIAIYNEKGRIGKTYFACEVALRWGYNYATNQNRPRKKIEKILPDGQFLQVEPNGEFPVLPDDMEVVFDLAGELVGYESSIVSALEQADVILVPIINDSDTPEATAYALSELEQESDVTNNIVLIATDLGKGDIEELTDRMKPLLTREYPVFPVQHTRLFDRMMDTGKSVETLMDNNPFLRWPCRKVTSQLDNIFIYLSNEKKNDR